MDEEIINAAREAVGSEAMLMVDAGARDAFWHEGYNWAQRTAAMLPEYGFYWFEEPLCPTTYAINVLLRQNSPLPIARGEVFTRRQSFVPWLQGGAFDIVQLDVTKVGGISEERRIVWKAEDNGVRFIPHGWNPALGLAADLHLASAIENIDLTEYLMGFPCIDDLVQPKWQLEAERKLPIPDRRRVGNLDTVEKCTAARSQAL